MPQMQPRTFNQVLGCRNFNLERTPTCFSFDRLMRFRGYSNAHHVLAAEHMLKQRPYTGAMPTSCMHVALAYSVKRGDLPLGFDGPTG